MLEDVGALVNRRVGVEHRPGISWGEARQRSCSRPSGYVRARGRVDVVRLPPEAVVSHTRADRRSRGRAFGPGRFRERFHRDQRLAPAPSVRGRTDTGRTRRGRRDAGRKHSNRVALRLRAPSRLRASRGRAAIRRAPSQDDGSSPTICRIAPAWRRSLSGSTRHHDGSRPLSCGFSSESSPSSLGVHGERWC